MILIQLILLTSVITISGLNIYSENDLIKQDLIKIYKLRFLQKKSKRKVIKGRMRRRIKGRMREWLNEYEEWLYMNDRLDFGNNQLLCEEGDGSGCYKFKKITKNQRKQLWKKLQKKLKRKKKKWIKTR